MAKKTQIVVVGGGAGGLELVRKLGSLYGRKHHDIILVDKQHRRPVKRVCVLSEDGRKLTHEDLVWAERSEIESGAKGQAA